MAKSSAYRAELMCKELRGLGNLRVCPTALCKQRFVPNAGHTTISLPALQTPSQAQAPFCPDPKACESLQRQSSGMRINFRPT